MLTEPQPSSFAQSHCQTRPRALTPEQPCKGAMQCHQEDRGKKNKVGQRRLKQTVGGQNSAPVGTWSVAFIRFRPSRWCKISSICSIAANTAVQQIERQLLKKYTMNSTSNLRRHYCKEKQRPANLSHAEQPT